MLDARCAAGGATRGARCATRGACCSARDARCVAIDAGCGLRGTQRAALGARYATRVARRV
eukprot:3692316-Lingulodinium_polyedra.AAC.1